MSSDERAGRGVAVACLLMAAAELFRLFALAGYRPVVGEAAGFQLAAAIVIAVAAGRELRTAYRSEEESTAGLIRTIADLQHRMAALGPATVSGCTMRGRPWSGSSARQSCSPGRPTTT